jgi:cholesterol oxidase
MNYLPEAKRHGAEIFTDISVTRVSREGGSWAVHYKGRVFSSTQGTQVHPGLYVSDGSVIPMSLSVNPSLTISALTKWCCALIAQDYGWTLNYTF